MGVFTVKDDTDWRQLATNYATWQAEDEKYYKEEYSYAQARMAGAGVQRKSDLWNSTLEGVDKRYADTQETLRKGSTYQSLQKRYAEENTVSAANAAFGLGMERPEMVMRDDTGGSTSAMNRINSQYVGAPIDKSIEYLEGLDTKESRAALNENSFDSFLNKFQRSGEVRSATEPSAADKSMQAAKSAAGGRLTRGIGSGPTATGSWLDEEEEE